jgi:hypothetical protein
MRSEPAAYSLVLQIAVESLGKGLVVVGVAQKERMVLNGLSEQCREIINEDVRKADVTQKESANVFIVRKSD